jgi:hypothetical protein
VFAVVATMAMSVLGSASPAGAAKGGNSDAAHACQKGGWQHLFRSDGTAFANQDACVSYAAHGGTLKTVPNSQQLCGQFGGTYGATNQTPDAFSTVYFSCNNIPQSTVQLTVFDTLATPCMAEHPGANAAASGGEDSPVNFTCGVFA